MFQFKTVPAWEINLNSDEENCVKIGTEAVLFKNKTERIDFGLYRVSFLSKQANLYWYHKQVVLFFVKGSSKQLGLCQFIS